MFLVEPFHEWKEDNNIGYKLQYLKERKISMEQWEWKRDILCYKGRIFLCSQSNLKQRILMESCNSMVVGHLRFLKIYQII